MSCVDCRLVCSSFSVGCVAVGNGSINFSTASTNSSLGCFGFSLDCVGICIWSSNIFTASKHPSLGRSDFSIGCFKFSVGCSGIGLVCDGSGVCCVDGTGSDIRCLGCAGFDVRCLGCAGVSGDCVIISCGFIRFFFLPCPSSSRPVGSIVACPALLIPGGTRVLGCVSWATAESLVAVGGEFGRDSIL